MKDGNVNVNAATTSRELSERQAEVLDELQVKGVNGCAHMYRRALSAVKTRLIMDDEYDPGENLGLVRVLTMLESDLAVLCGVDTEPAAAE